MDYKRFIRDLRKFRLLYGGLSFNFRRSVSFDKSRFRMRLKENDK
ncbi:hypothetical protein LCGC14_2834590 [marine sediment metagenome]|uniref:Uncharacterized protein n=1 Tax=marine sediment metagenome TaxID=412755 RepID=A0A0F8YZM7_9ZZZZ